jgi:hypothetical protein
MLMTPTSLWPGLDTDKDVTDTDGKMDFWILASVEDMNRLDKQGPRHLLYQVEYARNAPLNTPLDERVKKRRGIPPHLRAFAETLATDTMMITRVPHLDEWLAAYWARRLSTWPSPVLFDGSVDRKGDYEDLGWDAGVPLEAGGVTGRALRWDRKVMVGSELPKDVGAIYVRIYASAGDESLYVGAHVRISFPQGIVESERFSRGPMGRAPPLETAALVLQAEELPQRDGTMLYGNPSFEAEIRLPELPGDGPYVVRVSFGYLRAGSDAIVCPVGQDSQDPMTWPLVPDLLGPAPEAPAATPAPPGNLPKYKPGSR